mmetsp:Transcript_22554/g.31402  ORF Transcript_22554/g.31402 Transcript_22554/m.31402 type:complete len:607 (+) Transcript_22554:98-1918(+)
MRGAGGGSLARVLSLLLALVVGASFSSARSVFTSGESERGPSFRRLLFQPGDHTDLYTVKQARDQAWTAKAQAEGLAFQKEQVEQHQAQQLEKSAKQGPSQTDNGQVIDPVEDVEVADIDGEEVTNAENLEGGEVVWKTNLGSGKVSGEAKPNPERAAPVVLQGELSNQTSLPPPVPRQTSPVRLHMHAGTKRVSHPVASSQASQEAKTKAEQSTKGKLRAKAAEVFQMLRNEESPFEGVEAEQGEGEEGESDSPPTPPSSSSSLSEEIPSFTSGRNIVRKTALRDNVYSKTGTIEHGRWVRSTTGWIFISSNSCVQLPQAPEGTGTFPGVVHQCSGVGADSRLREVLSVPEGGWNSPNDTEVFMVAKSESLWKHFLDKFQRARICNGQARHLAPYWCKTEVGTSGQLAHDLDTSEERWQRHAVRREHIKSNLLAVMRIRDQFQVEQAKRDAELDERTQDLAEKEDAIRAQLELIQAQQSKVRKERKVLRDKAKSVDQELTGMNEALKLTEHEEVSSWKAMEETRDMVQKIRNMNKQQYHDFVSEELIKEPNTASHRSEERVVERQKEQQKVVHSMLEKMRNDLAERMRKEEAVSRHEQRANKEST